MPPNPTPDTRDGVPPEELIEAVVRSGVPHPRIMGDAIQPFRVQSRGDLTWMGEDEPGAQADLALEAACQSLPLFEPGSWQVRSLALWRREQPRVHVPDLEMEAQGCQAPNLVPPPPDIRRGEFRLPVPACHLIQIPPKANIAKPGPFPAVAWHLPTYPLGAFTPKTRTYLRWYARERLKFDPDNATVLGLCCPIPAMPLNLLDWQSQAGGHGRLIVEPQGPPDPQLEDRDGYVLREGGGLRLHLLPVQS